jgi:hypothetical protein
VQIRPWSAADSGRTEHNSRFATALNHTTRPQFLPGTVYNRAGARVHRAGDWRWRRVDIHGDVAIVCTVAISDGMVHPVRRAPIGIVTTMQPRITISPGGMPNREMIGVKIGAVIGKLPPGIRPDVAERTGRNTVIRIVVSNRFSLGNIVITRIADVNRVIRRGASRQQGERENGEQYFHLLNSLTASI